MFWPSSATTVSIAVKASSVDVIRRGQERVRTGPWRGDQQVALLAPVPAAPFPSAEFVTYCAAILAGRGFTKVVTSALTPAEQAGFLEAGFTLQENLHVLSLDLPAMKGALSEPHRAGAAPPDGRRWGTRRVTKARLPLAMSVDAAAFAPFWRMDDSGLAEALTATPRVRFRCVLGPDGAVVGYAICGRSGRKGFVQRLAVHPLWHRRGVGRLLLVDGISWMRRWGVVHVVVNTQLGNEAALSLYRAIGFRSEPTGLSVLTAGLR
jgi:ribosomal protein S18 acetylase RimI-like enzyme